MLARVCKFESCSGHQHYLLITKLFGTYRVSIKGDGKIVEIIGKLKPLIHFVVAGVLLLTVNIGDF